MPVILERENESTWLHADGPTAKGLLDPYRGDDLDAVPISTVVNDPSNDSPATIEPIVGGSGQPASEIPVRIDAWSLS